MSDEDAAGGDRLIRRRDVLAATATTAGMAGALTGVGTSGFLADREGVGNLVTAGTLDLAACWEREGKECSPTSDALPLPFDDVGKGDTGVATLRCGLPDDGRNNPAWVWLRTSCPTDACGLERAIRLTMWYDSGCDSDRGSEGAESVQYLAARDGTLVRDLRLCDALTRLREGVLLDGDPSTGTVAPLGPDEDCCIGVAWTVEGLCTAKGDSLDVTFELHGEQARHVDPANPWPAAPCTVDCSDTGRCDCYPGRFVAFCAGAAAIDVDAVTDLSWSADSVSWTATVALDTVVLYDGQSTFETFGPADGFSAGIEHTVARGDGELLSAREARETYGQRESDPCPDGSDDGCGVRYNFDEETWDCVWAAGPHPDLWG